MTSILFYKADASICFKLQSSCVITFKSKQPLCRDVYQNKWLNYTLNVSTLLSFSNLNVLNILQDFMSPTVIKIRGSQTSDDDTKWSSRLEWKHWARTAKTTEVKGQQIPFLLWRGAAGWFTTSTLHPAKSRLSAIRLMFAAGVQFTRTDRQAQLGAICGTAHWPRPLASLKACDDVRSIREKVPLISIWFFYYCPKGQIRNIPFFWPVSQNGQPD